MKQFGVITGYFNSICTFLWTYRSRSVLIYFFPRAYDMHVYGMYVYIVCEIRQNTQGK